jgi:hypothetical protein
MVHNAARTRGDSFSGSSEFDVENLVVDLYYWFDKSTKRKNELNEFCVFSGNTFKHVLRHASTRWQKYVYRGTLEGISNRIQKSYLLFYVLHYVPYDKNSQQSKHRGFSPVPYF